MEKLDCCPKRRECTINDCTDCFAFWCYEFGFAKGASQAVRAMNGIEPIILKNQPPLFLQSFDGAEELERLERKLKGCSE